MLIPKNRLISGIPEDEHRAGRLQPDLRRTPDFRETEVADLVILRDFMVERVISTAPDEDLNATLRKMNEHGLHEIQVVALEDPRRVLAMRTRQLVIHAYHSRLRAVRVRHGTPVAPCGASPGLRQR